MIKFSFFLLFTICAALLSCSDDDAEDPSLVVPRDKVSPAVKIMAPANGDSIPIMNGIRILAEITDDTRLDKITVSFTEHFGTIVLSEVNILNFKDYKRYTLEQLHRVPKNMLPASYMITVEAKDQGRNMASENVVLTLTAPDVSQASFVEPFVNAFFDDTWVEVLEWYGYNYYELGIAFDARWLSTVLHFMANTSYDDKNGVSEAEWQNFVRDFKVTNQVWADWDADRDGELNDAEFHEGISRLNFFEDWEKDQNKVIDEVELAAGIFSRWDHDGDQVLNSGEYLEKFYTYLYSRGE